MPLFSSDFSDGMMASWRVRAACRGLEQLFHARAGEKSVDYNLRQERCRAVCSMCVVKPECLDWALEDANEGIDMMLGGMTYDERRVHLRARSKKRS